MPRSAKEANNPILLKVQSLQLSFRPAGVSLGGGGGGGAKAPPGPPLRTPLISLTIYHYGVLCRGGLQERDTQGLVTHSRDHFIGFHQSRDYDVSGWRSRIVCAS